MMSKYDWVTQDIFDGALEASREVDIAQWGESHNTDPELVEAIQENAEENDK
jgi:hypothetical protein